MAIQETLSFGRWLKQLRAAQDWTQDALAERVGCAPQTIRTFESGTRRPSRQMAERLSDVFKLMSPERELFLQRARAKAQPPDDPSPQVPTQTETKPQSNGATAIDASPGYATLPVAPNALIGRPQELAEAVHYVATATSRLVTLVGPGGAGKTRLALQVATTATTFKDGVVWVALAPVSHATHVAAAIMDALHLPLQGPQLPELQVIDALRERDMLLVLDNFEHVVAAVDLLQALLQQAPRLHLLVTSRERLRVQGEWTIDIGGLPVPDEEQWGPAMPSPAVLLFLERARQVVHTFALTPENAGAVARICRMLQGMPLGIEMAATWVRMLTPAEIADEIAQSLDFLASADRSAAPRQRSLRAVFDHSWELLNAEERSVFTQLAVFRGGCTRTSAAGVTDATTLQLAALVDKSLVQRISSDGVQPRYDLHELVRQYAEEKLAEAGKLRATRDQHLLFFLDWVEQVDAQLVGPQQQQQLRAMRSEQSNVRAALEWTLESGQRECGMRLAAALVWFWYLSSNWLEGRSWLEAMLAAATTPSKARAQALLGAGLLAADAAHAEVLLEESLQLYRDLDDAMGVAWAQFRLCKLALQRQQLARAEVLARASLTTFREQGNTWGTAQVLLELGNVAVAQGNLEQALPLFDEGIRLLRVVGDNGAIALSLMYAGMAARSLGELQRARQLFEEALERYQAMDTKGAIAWALCQLGLVTLGMGDAGQAHAFLAWSLRLRGELRDQRGSAEALEGLAELAGAQEQWARAARLWGAAAAARLAADAPRPILEQVQVDRHIAIVRQQLATAPWETAWTAGCATPLEETITYALTATTYEGMRGMS